MLIDRLKKLSTAQYFTLSTRDTDTLRDILRLVMAGKTSSSVISLVPSKTVSQSLPDDLLSLTFSFLTIPQNFSVRRVCRSFARVATKASSFPPKLAVINPGKFYVDSESDAERFTGRIPCTALGRLPKDCAFRSLHCASSDITDQQLACISRTHLRLIDFGFPRNDAVSVRGLAHLFGPVVQTCEIRWSNQKLLSVVGLGLRTSASLHTLRFSFNPVTDEDIKAWDLKTDTFPGIKHLTIDTLVKNKFSDLSSASLSALTSAFPLLQTLRLKVQTITAEGFAALTRLRDLQELDLEIDPDATPLPDKILRNWPPADRAQLRELALTHVRISWSTVVYFAFTGVLECLKLYRAEFLKKKKRSGDEDTARRCKAEGKCSLQELKISSEDEILHALRRLPELSASLRKLDLDIRLDDDDEQEVCQYVAQLHNLQTLRLLTLTDTWVAQLSQLPELEVLQAYSGDFSPKSFPCFGKTGMPKLQWLLLRWTDLPQVETSTLVRECLSWGVRVQIQH